VARLIDPNYANETEATTQHALLAERKNPRPLNSGVIRLKEYKAGILGEASVDIFAVADFDNQDQ